MSDPTYSSESTISSIYSTTATFALNMAQVSADSQRPDPA